MDKTRVVMPCDRYNHPGMVHGADHLAAHLNTAYKDLREARAKLGYSSGVCETIAEHIEASMTGHSLSLLIVGCGDRDPLDPPGGRGLEHN